jgi:hypothetical protein
MQFAKNRFLCRTLKVISGVLGHAKVNLAMNTCDHASIRISSSRWRR